MEQMPKLKGLIQLLNLKLKKTSELCTINTLGGIKLLNAKKKHILKRFNIDLFFRYNLMGFLRAWIKVILKYIRQNILK